MGGIGLESGENPEGYVPGFLAVATKQPRRVLKMRLTTPASEKNWPGIKEVLIELSWVTYRSLDCSNRYFSGTSRVSIIEPKYASIPLLYYIIL